MLTVEYLVILNNESIKSSDPKSYNHLLQSDPEILIKDNKIIFKKNEFDYNIESGKIKNPEKNYFDLIFSCQDITKIDTFNEMLEHVKSILYLSDKSLQILYDGVSLFYSQKAYPLIFEIENLMRKLITKFMLINVGDNWIKERVPDDVKKTVKIQNKDITYLHNVDFIQLKNFFFSDNFLTHKENLIEKLKNANNLEELNLEELKLLIPYSNWEKFFSDKVDFKKEKLDDLWVKLYDLRCKVAHNKIFSKADYEEVLKYSTEFKPVLEKSIDNLREISITENEKKILLEAIENLDLNDGLYFNNRAFIRKSNIMITIIEKLGLQYFKDELSYSLREWSLMTILQNLFEKNLINIYTYWTTNTLLTIRNQLVHNEAYNDIEKEIHFYMRKLDTVIDNLSSILEE